MLKNAENLPLNIESPIEFQIANNGNYIWSYAWTIVSKIHNP